MTTCTAFVGPVVGQHDGSFSGPYRLSADMVADTVWTECRSTHTD